MTLAPAPAGQFWRSVRRTLVASQRLVAFPIAIGALDAALFVLVVWGGGWLTSFTSLARREFDGAETVEAITHALARGDARAWACVVGYFVLRAAMVGWLRAGFLLGLIGEGATLRPPLFLVGQLVGLDLLISAASLGSVALVGVDSILLLLPLLIAVVYADYAVVIERIALPQGIARSVRTVVAIPGRTLGAFLGGQVAFELAHGVFASGFEDKQYVQPTYLAAYLLLIAMLQLLIDVVLVTLYRSAPLNADGASGQRSGSGDPPPD